MELINGLIDVRFDRLITRRLLGVVYALAIGLHLLAGLVGAVALIASGGWGLLIGLVVVPAITLLGALVLRVAFEAVIVYFRAAEDLRELKAAS